MIYFRPSFYQSYSRIKIYDTLFPSIISTLLVFISPNFLDYSSKTLTSLPNALVNLLFRDFITSNYTKFLLVFSLRQRIHFYINSVRFSYFIPSYNIFLIQPAHNLFLPQLNDLLSIMSINAFYLSNTII